MKRLIAFVACIGLAFAFLKVGNSQGLLSLAGSPPVAGACATSDTALAHDEMLYGWGAGDDPTPWTGPTSVTDVDAANFVTNYDTSALTTGKPTGACNTGLQCTLTGTGGGHDTYQFDRGSIIGVGTTCDIRFYVYVQTPLDSSRITILNAGQSGDPDSGRNCSVELQTDGVPQVRGDNVTSSAWISLTENSWNLIHLHSDATPASSSISVNGGTPELFTSSATVGIQYVYVGPGSLAAGRSCVWVTDLVAVNTP